MISWVALPVPICAVLLGASIAHAAETDHSQMPMPSPTPSTSQEEEPLGEGPNVQTGMAGALGQYSMMRDSSGTSWQPEITPMAGIHGMLGTWSTMIHGDIFAVYDDQGGERGDTKVFSESMAMGMAQRQWGEDQLTLRAMLSLDPLMGARGYPLLLQTGETADGRTKLIDRQHPHDFVMELAGAYSRRIGENSSAFLYLGYPGEPALGPPTYMHRFSAENNPEAPISHHWLDSTHVAFGVATLGFILGAWKAEASLFTGREPDQHRWDFDSPRMDSVSARLTFNPSEAWSFQISYGTLHSPEQLEPDVDQNRLTASAIYNRKFEHANWQTTAAWGQNDFRPGPTLNAYLLETAIHWDAHTVFARAELAEKNELFEPPSPLAGRIFDAAKFSLGYVYDIPISEHVSLGIGALGSVYALASALEPAYGDPASGMLFARLKIM